MSCLPLAVVIVTVIFRTAANEIVALLPLPIVVIVVVIAAATSASQINDFTLDFAEPIRNFA